jgi:hypothetical protein
MLDPWKCLAHREDDVLEGEDPLDRVEGERGIL